MSNPNPFTKLWHIDIHASKEDLERSAATQEGEALAKHIGQPLSALLSNQLFTLDLELTKSLLKAAKVSYSFTIARK